MPSPRLIITADDYGLNASVNAAIRSGIQAGIVSSVHVLMNMVTKQELDALRQTINSAGSKCGIGLHLNTTWGPAMIQKPANFKHGYEGHVDASGKIIYHYRGLNTYIDASTKTSEMAAELHAQFNALVKYLGDARKIDAISSHQNIHFWSKRYISIINGMAKPYSIPVRSPMRWVTEGQHPIPPFYPYGQGKKGIGPLVRVGLKKIKTAVKIPSTGRLLATPLFPKKLIAYTRTVYTHGSKLTPRNATGHWFGQPSWQAMEWLLNTLPNLNTDESGYATEIYMHLAESEKGADHRWDYKQKYRVLEYNTISNAEFISKFNALIAKSGIRHGSFRKSLK